MADLQIVWRLAEELKPSERNPRTHSKKQIRQIAESIERFGWTNPVLIDGEGGIIAGHGRVDAAKLLGLEEVPTIGIDNLSEAEKRILVPGCGRGHDVVELTRCGFDVTALDIAPKPIAFLRQRLGEQRLHADVQQVDLFAWEPDGAYDAIYDQTSLCAMVPSQWPDYERRLHRWLHSDGQLFILFMQTERSGGPPFHCDLSEMRRLFSEARWHWSDEPPLKVPHSVGFVEQGCALARKN